MDRLHCLLWPTPPLIPACRIPIYHEHLQDSIPRLLSSKATEYFARQSITSMRLTSFSLYRQLSSPSVQNTRSSTHLVLPKTRHGLGAMANDSLRPVAVNCTHDIRVHQRTSMAHRYILQSEHVLHVDGDRTSSFLGSTSQCCAEADNLWERWWRVKWTGICGSLGWRG